jgi:DNA-binding FadR family transcriptional regulator
LLKYLAEARAEGRDGVEENFAFHLAIVRISRNPYIIQALEFLSAAMRRSIAEGFAGATDQAEGIPAIYQEHRRILQAIESGDVAGAGEAVRRHTEAGRTRPPPAQRTPEKS